MDKVIMKILKEWKQESGLKEPIRFKLDKNIIYIYTGNLGFLIGRGGITYNKYADRLVAELPMVKGLKISLQEVSRFWA